MQLRLFWKILLIFWLTSILGLGILWNVFSFQLSTNSKSHLINRVAVSQMSAAASIIESAGIDVFNHVYKKWAEREQNVISVRQVEESAKDCATKDILKRYVKAPDGRYYAIKYDLASAINDPLIVLYNIPIALIFFLLICGLTLSFLLAWWLARPMEQLKHAFSLVAGGDFDTRLNPQLFSRHDEFKELATQFNAMVKQLDILMTTREGLLHDISHELRTPLARLQLAIGLAQQNPQQITNSLQRIELEAQRLERMISEILAFSRSGYAGENQDDYFEFVSLVEFVIDDVNYEAQQLHVSVKLCVDLHVDQQIIIHGDAELIRRAIENIMRNAVRYSPEYRQVNVAIIRHDNDVELQVRDQGPGVDASKLTAIFEPFFRIKTTKSGEGYGLGLAIARKVILNHHGSISAMNAEGGGLILVVKLPICTVSFDLLEP